MQPPASLGLLLNYTALARIDPAVGERSIKRDVTLDPGSTFKGRLEAPDGSPLIGARSFGLTDRDDGQTVLKNAGFTVWAFDPRRPRDVFFQHPEKGLVGVLEPPKETGGTVLVKMKPGSTISGRLVDADGKPRADMKMRVRFRLRGKRRFISTPLTSSVTTSPLNTTAGSVRSACCRATSLASRVTKAASCPWARRPRRAKPRISATCG